MGQGSKYGIRIRGQLGPEWSSWFTGLSVDAEPSGTTRLSGRLADLAALHGLLAAIRDLGLTLVSLELIPGPEEPAEKGD